MDHAQLEHMRAAYRRKRPQTAIVGRGNQRCAVGYATVDGTIITDRVPVRPIVEGLTAHDPQMRRRCLQAMGCVGQMPTTEVGFLDDIIEFTKKAVTRGLIFPPLAFVPEVVISKADDLAQKVVGKRIFENVIKIGDRVVDAAKDVAYSPYFQAALVALPVPGTAAIAAGIRAVQTIEALADQAAAGNFDAKAALGLAKAGLQLQNAQTPEAKRAAMDVVRRAEAQAKKMGIKPKQIKQAVDLVQTSAQKVIKKKGQVEKLMRDPNAVPKLMRKIAQTQDPAKKSALKALADTLKAKKTGKVPSKYKGSMNLPTEAELRAYYAKKRKKEGKKMRKGGPQKFNRSQKWMRTKDGHIVPAEKRVREWGWRVRGSKYGQLPSPALQNYINVRRLDEARTMARAYKGRMSAWQKKANEQRKMARAYKGRIANWKNKAQEQREEIQRLKAQLRKGAIERPERLERAAKQKGKALYMVQAPSRKVYPVAL